MTLDLHFLQTSLCSCRQTMQKLNGDWYYYGDNQNCIVQRQHCIAEVSKLKFYFEIIKLLKQARK